MSALTSKSFRIKESWLLILLIDFILSVSVNSEYIDLSYSINNDTVYFPGQKVEFVLNRDIEGISKGGYWYSSFSFCMGEHGGTHLDAPYHFNENGWTLDEIPQSHLIDVQGVLIDVEKKVISREAPDKFMLEVEDLIEYESVNGHLPQNSVILLHTGWSKYWSDKVKYLGWNNSTNLEKPTLSFPGVSEAAAKWLVNERRIVGFGIDTPSVDVGDNKGSYPVHIIFSQHQIYNIENLANLHLVIRKEADKRISGGGYVGGCQLRLFVLPIKITGGTGGPARVLVLC